jgi:hypothetical protein
MLITKGVLHHGTESRHLIFVLESTPPPLFFLIWYMAFAEKFVTCERLYAAFNNRKSTLEFENIGNFDENTSKLLIRCELVFR